MGSNPTPSAKFLFAANHGILPSMSESDDVFRAMVAALETCGLSRTDIAERRVIARHRLALVQWKRQKSSELNNGVTGKLRHPLKWTARQPRTLTSLKKWNATVAAAAPVTAIKPTQANARRCQQILPNRPSKVPTNWSPIAA